MNPLLDCRRVLVIGCAGAGKTSFAIRLASHLDLPLFHLDAHYWNPGWVPSEPDEWERRHAALIAWDEWILDGNYTRTLALRLQRADAAVFLDFDRTTCLIGALQRVVGSQDRPGRDLPPDCPERVDWEFLRWIWDFPRNVRPRVVEALDAAEHVVRVHLRDRNEAERFLAEIHSASDAGCSVKPSTTEDKPATARAIRS